MRLATTYQPYEPHIELAIDVFKAQTSTLVNSLKDFLTVLPNPKCVEEVLTEALYQLAESDPDACRWILRNSSCLEPELDVVEVAIKVANSKLEHQGFVDGQDFKFEPSGRLHLHEQAKLSLMVGTSAGDRLLLEEILQVRD